MLNYFSFLLKEKKPKNKKRETAKQLIGTHNLFPLLRERASGKMFEYRHVKKKEIVTSNGHKKYFQRQHRKEISYA